MVIDEDDIDKAWVIPAQSDNFRMPYQNKLAVYTTNNGGKYWQALRNGLPQEAAFDLVLRDAFHTKWVNQWLSELTTVTFMFPTIKDRIGIR